MAEEEYDYGPLRTFEVTWRNRPPEMVQGHSVQFDSAGGIFARPVEHPRFRIYGMFPGRRWRLMLMAPESDVLSIRDVTEDVAALEAMNEEAPGE